MLSTLFPFLSWFRGYDRSMLRADLVAGMTVALVLIPQSMAYAQLAGLPSYYGLYAAFLPPMVAALFGSSRQLATGPVAVVSLMTAATLEPLATAGSASFIAYAVMLSMLVGLFQFLLGVLRLGLVVNFLSHPVVNGFTNAAALIIATSQLGKMFGVEADKADHHYETVLRVLEAARHSTHWPTLGMAALAMAIMVGSKKINPKIPGVLAAVGLSTLLSWGVGFERNARVTADDIASDRVQTMILDFSRSAEEIRVLDGQRLELNEKLGEASSATGAEEKTARLRLQHELALLNLRLEEIKAENNTIRKTLRETPFAAPEAAAGERRFLPAAELAEGSSADGRNWRLHVAMDASGTAKLTMVGGGAVVGGVPGGLPRLTFPQLDLQVFFQLMPYAIIISLLGFMEAISIAKAMAARTGQKLDPNQELIGQGLANIIGSLGSGYPVSGSFSRSAVNLQAGGVTGLANVFSALIVVVTLLFFTPLLYHLPQAVLAAVIMMAVIGLVNVHGVAHAWKTQRSDGIIAIITFAATLYFAPHLDKGIMIGVGLSTAVFLYRRMQPKVTTLAMGRDGVLQCAADHRLQRCRHIAAVRFDGTLFFANASYLDEQIFKIRSANPHLSHILLVADGINDMDASGEETLTLIKGRLTAAGIGFSLCRVKENVLAVMRRSGLFEKIGAANIHASEAAALAAIIPGVHDKTLGKACRVCSLVRHVPAPAEECPHAAGSADGAAGCAALPLPARGFCHIKTLLDKVVTSLAASA